MTDTTKSPIQWLSVIFLAAIVWIMFIPSAPALAAEQAQPCAKEILQAVVHVSGLSLSQLIKSIPDDQSRVDLVRKFVQSVRFFSDNSGYIYVYTLDGVVIGHGGMKNLEGTNPILFGIDIAVSNSVVKPLWRINTTQSTPKTFFVIRALFAGLSRRLLLCFRAWNKPQTSNSVMFNISEHCFLPIPSGIALVCP